MARIVWDPKDNFAGSSQPGTLHDGADDRGEYTLLARGSS
jgi:hypothetical protein